MTLTVTHTTPADGTFSATGAAAWDATHTLSLTGTSLQVQYNNAGDISGMSGTSWDDTNRALTITGATVTTSNPVLNLSQTWNAGAVVFTATKVNVTNTASSGDSLLFDYQVGGTSALALYSNGFLRFRNSSSSIINSPASNVFNIGTYNTSNIQTNGGFYGFVVGSDNRIGWASTANWLTTASTQLQDTILTRKAAASLRFGNADAAAPVAQTIGVQSVVAGTIDGSAATAPFTIAGSQSTGTGAAGAVRINTSSAAATTGIAQNALATVATFGPNTLTGSQTTPVLDLAQTWNTSGTATGLKLNVTNTASAAASLLMDLQVGGTSCFSVSKAGLVSSMLNTGAGFRTNLSGGIGFEARWGLSFVIASITSTAGNGVVTVSADGKFQFSNAALSVSSPDLFITRKAAASLRFGDADAAAPVAQTIGVQSVVAGTSNKAGENFKIAGSQGTGSGIGGSIIFQTAAANSGGGATVQNTLTDALTIDSVGSIQLVRALTVATLPGTPLAGMIARVSDALAPAIGSTVASGGAAYALVNYNGANWTVIGV